VKAPPSTKWPDIQRKMKGEDTKTGIQQEFEAIASHICPENGVSQRLNLADFFGQHRVQYV